jgi:uncharacterized membrane protein
MLSKARIGNHPVHPMLILIPAGAFLIALCCDLIYLATGQPRWWNATVPVLAIGVAGGVLAAVPGLIDLIAVVPKQGAKRIGLMHMALNLLAVVLFAWNAWLRWNAAAPPEGAGSLEFWLTLLGTALIAVSGWLGGALVYEYHVGVLEHPQAKDPEP